MGKLWIHSLSITDGKSIYIYNYKHLIKWNGHIWIYKECMGNRGYIPYKIRECIYVLIGIIHFVYGI